MTTHYCTKCMKSHALHYVKGLNDAVHLCVECPRSNYFIPFVAGLEILTKPSRHLNKIEQKSKQPELL